MENASFMKKMLMMVAIAMMTTVVLTSCEKDDDSDDWEPSLPSQRTVMVYMAAKNNLAIAANNDISEMEEGMVEVPANSTVVLFVDKLTSNPYIAKLTNDKNTPMQVLYQYDSPRYDSDPATFREAIEKMMELCPAKEYALVLWGHGTGWAVTNDSVASEPSRRAYGYDSSNGKWMNITQMVTALDGLPKMKFIFADCCNMACAEVAYALRNRTEYLIGSPAEIPGSGAPYHLLMKELFNTSDTFYKNIVDTYYDYYANDYVLNIAERMKWPYMIDTHYSVPLAAINTAYIEALATATHDAVSQAEGGYPMYPETPDLSGIAYYFGYDFPVMYDMRAFIHRIAPAAFDQWERVYKQAVPHYRMSMKWMTDCDGDRNSSGYYPNFYNLIGDFDSFDATLPYGCVSMFIPKVGDGYDQGDHCYNQRACNFEWNRLMEWNNYGWTFIQP